METCECIIPLEIKDSDRCEKCGGIIAPNICTDEKCGAITAHGIKRCRVCGEKTKYGEKTSWIVQA